MSEMPISIRCGCFMLAAKASLQMFEWNGGTCLHNLAHNSSFSLNAPKKLQRFSQATSVKNLVGAACWLDRKQTTEPAKQSARKQDCQRLPTSIPRLSSLLTFDQSKKCLSRSPAQWPMAPHQQRVLGPAHACESAANCICVGEWTSLPGPRSQATCSLQIAWE